MNAPYTWETMSDYEMLAIIRSEGTQMTPEQVTTEFISGNKNTVIILNCSPSW